MHSEDTVKFREENIGKHSMTSTIQMFSQSPKATEIKAKINQ